MGNVNMEAYQVKTSDKTMPTVQKAIDKLKNSESMITEDIAILYEALADKADRVNIAGSFSAETQYFVDDLVYHEDILYKCTTAHLGEWDAGDFSATNIAAEILNAGGGAELKTLKYTGTGTTSYTLDFGEDTPATILQIIPEPGESVLTNNYEYLSGFAWGGPFTYGVWASKNNNLPSNHGGFNIAQVTFSDNTCTITGASASAAANYEGQKYVVYYLA